jgi:hypothetical protein
MNGGSFIARIATSLVVAAVACGAGLFYFGSVGPDRTFEPFEPFEDYPVVPMQAAMGVDRVSKEHEAILKLGSRFPGQPGWRLTADVMHAAYERAGLEIYEQEIDTVTPRTAYREIYRITDGSRRVERLNDIEIYPLMPNQLQPVVTPAEGITGELVLLDPETLNTRVRFDDCIGLLDLRKDRVHPDFEYQFHRYAALGVKALIVSHQDGLEHAVWNNIGESRGKWDMISSLPINYVRLAATKDIFNYLGQTVRVRVRVNYERVRSRSIFGVLRAPNPSEEALFVPAPYDCPSFLPDRSPGVHSALAPAVQLRLLDGLQSYRETLKRDIIFAAIGSTVMAEDGHNRILSLIHKNKGIRPKTPLSYGEYDSQSDRIDHTIEDPADPRQGWLAEQWEENKRTHWKVERVLELFKNEGFSTDHKKTRSARGSLDLPTRNFLDEQFTYVVDTLAFELKEPLDRAKIEIERDPEAMDTESPVFRRFFTAKRRYDEVVAAGGYRLGAFLEKNAELAARIDLRMRFLERMKELSAFHLDQRRELVEGAVLLNLFSSYKRIGLFSTRLAPVLADAADGPEVINIDDGSGGIQSTANTFMRMVVRAKYRLGLDDSLKLPVPDSWGRSGVRQHTPQSVPRQSAGMWGGAGYPTFVVYNLDRRESYGHFASPVDLPFMHDLSSMDNTLSVIGEVFLSMAHGNGSLDPTRITANNSGFSYGGRVLASDIGQSIVPDYPVKDALVANRSRPDSNMWAYPGHHWHPILITDVYGRYAAPHNFNDFPLFSNVFKEGLSRGGIMSPVAAKIGEDGLISHMKNEGTAAQRTYRSVRIPYQRAENVTIVVFRAAPVTVVDLTNPQTLNEYTNVEMIQSDGLASFERTCSFGGWRLRTTFLEPHRRFFLKMQSGAAGNELVKVTRAFAMNVGNTPEEDLENDLDGIGYLVADNPIIFDIASESAVSMAHVNGRRLALQNRYGMADARTNDYHDRVLTRLAESQAPGLSKKEIIAKNRDAVTYATLNHPVLRESVFEAVAGIMWYLALLVPFVFFFEKLLFCFSDVRKQITAHLVIFITVFAALRLLHPAFQMVRSSLMIVLSLIIIIISAGIALLFSSKFRENLEELGKESGKVAAAEVNKLGVVATAFVLGLNNMHRRKVRTGLTCLSLTLLTFAIISFTSTQDDLVEETRSVGKAQYQGMLIKKELNRGPDLAAISRKYGDRYDVCARGGDTGSYDIRRRKRVYPEISIVRKKEGMDRKVDTESIIRLRYNEPLRHQVRFLTNNGWFDQEDEPLTTEDTYPIFIPDGMADRLNITIRDVNQGGVTVWVRGKEHEVRGIFDSSAYDAITGLDGRPILPWDVNAIESLIYMGWGTGSVFREDDPRISSERTILAPGEGGRSLGVAVVMPEASFKEARDVIREHMEQTTRPLYFGLDGVAYRGQRTRKATLGGFMDLLLPLFIASLTVLNTMRGSVYERRDEIYVYNSVGIAPRYVFFMFIAEACVYAVVGSVLGYILSQGTGRILTALDLTGGLNMTFTSITTVYSSLAIFAAVLISTWFPARAAMEIAAPSEESGWELPDAKGDRLQFDLPFNFRSLERMGVLAFFNRWARNHGEGGSGRFIADEPDITLDSTVDSHGRSTTQPSVHSTIWLKPLDLAVSQRLTVAMLPDSATGEYKAQVTLKHLSGTKESWLRLNKGFVAEIRRHFLHWRAVSPAEQEELVAEAREWLGDRLVR